VGGDRVAPGPPGVPGELERGRATRLLRETESLAAEVLRERATRLLEQDAELVSDLTERRIDPYRTAAILEGRISNRP
jgi:hypothetical protein